MGGIDTKQIKDAAIKLAALDAKTKDKALYEIAGCLIANKESIAHANIQDVDKATKDGLPSPIIKRLSMDENKVCAVAAGIHSLMSLEDPVGKQLLATELADGLVMRRVTCPIGVIGVIFESRPDALVQIASLCLKSGDAVILKGGSEAMETNRLLTELIRKASVGCGLPEAWITQLETRAEIKEILAMDEDIDLLIPRGSNEFVRYIMDNTRIPVLGHADGICHCYVDAGADLDMAVKVAVDAKTQYVAVCNAIETLLVHEAVAPTFLPSLWAALNGGASGGANDGASGGVSGMKNNAADSGIASPPNVEIRGCAETRRILKDLPVKAASEDEWSAEYLDYILAVKVVGSLQDAIAHINQYGSKHSDAIITEDAEAVHEFMLYVDSANIFHNCSTRFSDGFRYGFGAEVGVSTSKIHARGPVGLEGLVTYKYLLSGHGDIVGDFEIGNRKFSHKPI